MNLTEIRDTLTQLIDNGVSEEKMYDDNDAHFFISDIRVSQYGKVVFECDEEKCSTFCKRGAE